MTSTSHDAALHAAPLTGRQKRHLRGLAHELQPAVHVGKGGLSDELLAALDAALAHHELIKVKFVDFKDQKAAACAEIEAATGARTAGVVGHVAILYRPAADPEDRRVRLPAAGGGA